MVNDNHPTLEQRLERVRDLRRKGYNCAQAVIMVFDDVDSLDAALTERITSALGGGIAGCGLTCGVVSAIAMITGAAGYTAPTSKKELYGAVRTPVEKFAAANDGLTLCRDLRQPGRKTCDQLIREGIALCHSHIYGE